ASGENREVLPEPKASTMKRTPDLHLGLRIRAAYRRHIARTARGWRSEIYTIRGHALHATLGLARLSYPRCTVNHIEHRFVDVAAGTIYRQRTTGSNAGTPGGADDCTYKQRQDGTDPHGRRNLRR